MISSLNYIYPKFRSWMRRYGSNLLSALALQAAQDISLGGYALRRLHAISSQHLATSHPPQLRNLGLLIRQISFKDI